MIAAVVPAAGRSARMGRPKLLIEFQGKPLIHRVVTALRSGGADRVIVVTPSASRHADAITAAVLDAGGEVIVPERQPAEMRDSVELALARLDAGPHPSTLLLAPGDVPGITPDLVARLLDVARACPDDVVIPAHDGRRGHPIVLPWHVAIQIRSLPGDAGVNRLVQQQGERVREVAVHLADEIGDLDTPEDLERWRAHQAAADASAMGPLDRAPGSGPTIRVRVRLFALARERAGCSEVDVELAPDATVGDLRRCLQEQVPSLGPLCARAMVSVDEEYASDEIPVTPASRLALIPPVSGGGDFTQ